MSAEDQDLLLDQLTLERTSPKLGKEDQSILKYALKLTSTPAQVNADDIQELRQMGFDDRGIHDICAITAYFAFVNRMADGLGVELEERFE